MTVPIDVIVGRCSRALATATVDRLGLVGRRRVGYAHRHVLPRGKTDAGGHDRPEQEQGPDPRAPIYAECPPATMFSSASRTRAIRS